MESPQPSPAPPALRSGVALTVECAATSMGQEWTFTFAAGFLPSAARSD